MGCCLPFSGIGLELFDSHASCVPSRLQPKKACGQSGISNMQLHLPGVIPGRGHIKSTASSASCSLDWTQLLPISFSSLTSAQSFCLDPFITRNDSCMSRRMSRHSASYLRRGVWACGRSLATRWEQASILPLSTRTSCAVPEWSSIKPFPLVRVRKELEAPTMEVFLVLGGDRSSMCD